MQCGELGLLPAVRQADRDTLVIANGFSCKTQIEQSGVERRALHVGQVMQMAREHGRAGYRGGPPELPYVGRRPGSEGRKHRLGLSAAAAGAVAGGATLAIIMRRRADG